jgi:hypothetical protein
MADFFVELSSFGTGIFGSPVAHPCRETTVLKQAARRERIPYSTNPNQHNGRPQWGRRSEREDTVGTAACGQAIVGRVRHYLTHLYSTMQQ